MFSCVKYLVAFNLRFFMTKNHFRFRCMLYPETLKELTESYNLGYQQARPEEVQKYSKELFATHNSTYKKVKDVFNEEEMSRKEFYKVKFTEALDLVRGRKVFLLGGEAFVPINDLQVSVFQKSKSL